MTFIPSLDGKLDINNSTSTAIGANGTYTGTATDVSRYSCITVNAYSDVSSANNGLNLQFSSDGTNWDHKGISYTYSAETSSIQASQVQARYYRLVYTNGPSPTTAIRIQTILNANANAPTSSSSATVNVSFPQSTGTTSIPALGSSFLLTKSVNLATDMAGNIRPMTNDWCGALRSSIVSPLSAFGEVSIADNTPVLQGDFVYGINDDLIDTLIDNTGSTVTMTNNIISCTTGAGVTNSISRIRSKRFLRYRAGQGCHGRFTGIFQGITGGEQKVGFGNFECGYFFGMSGPSFGIFHDSYSALEIRNLTVTNAATSAANVVVTLDGISVPVPVTVSTIQQNVNQIAGGVSFALNRPAWRAIGYTNSVQFVCQEAGPRIGTYSISGAGMVGTFSTITSGISLTSNFIPQSDWNLDNMSGLGGTLNPSGASINFSNGNVYAINWQYLGFGSVTFFVENPAQGMFMPVHQIRFANSQNTITNISNPSLPFLAYAKNVGSTTANTVRTASYAGFVQGPVRDLGIQRSFNITKNATTTIIPMFSIRNGLVYQGQASTAVIRPTILNVANGNTLIPSVFYVYTGGTLNPTAAFTRLDNTKSVADVDTTATVVNGAVIKYATGIGGSSNMSVDLSSLVLPISPGEILSVAVASFSGTPTVFASLQWVEEQ